MVKTISTIFFMFCGMVFIANAQTFKIDCETDTLTKNIGKDFYYDVHVDIPNISGEQLTLGWEVLDRKENNKWDFSLCDFGNCHVGIPDKGTMLTQEGNEDAFLKVSAHPMGTEDVCYFTFRVYNKDIPTESDTITLRADSRTSSIKVVNYTDFKTFPNPVSDILNIVSESETTIQQIKIFNLQGQVVYSEDMIESKDLQISVSDLNQGQYVLQIISDGIIRQSKFVKQ